MGEAPGSPREELQIPDPVLKEKEPSQEEVLASLEPTIEEELGPEVIEMIMEKVQDINEPGIAFSALGELGADKLKSLFKNGLLGDNWTDANEQLPKERWISNLSGGREATAWVERTRKGKNTIVHFNITGKMQESKIWEKSRNIPEFIYPHKRDIKSQIDMAGWTYIRRNGVTVLFDVSNFEELSREDFSKSKRINTFKSDSHTYSEIPAAEYGFNLRGRVAPRYFTGIIMRLDKPLPEYTDAYIRAYMFGYDNPETIEAQRESGRESVSLEAIANLRDRLISNSADIKDEIDQKKIATRVRDVIKVMRGVYKDRTDLILPIYNRAGDLLWPLPDEYKEKGFIPYEEVKKFVSGRDKDKKET